MNAKVFEIELSYYKHVCDMVNLLKKKYGIENFSWKEPIEKSIFIIYFKNGFVMEFIFSKKIVNIDLKTTFIISFQDESYELQEIPAGYLVTNSLQSFLSDICYDFQHSKNQEENLIRVLRYLKVDNNDNEISEHISSLLSKQQEEMEIIFGVNAG